MEGMAIVFDRHRWMCRGLFLVCCVVPTLTSLFWVCERHHPLRAQLLAERWSESLGQTLQIDECTSRTPGVYQLQGLVIADPETDVIRLESPQAELVCGHNWWDIQIGECSVQENHLGPLFAWLQHILALPRPARISITAPRVTAVPEPNSHQGPYAGRLSCTIETNTSQPTATIAWQASVNPTTTSELLARVTRDRSTHQILNKCSIYTNDTYVPVSWLAPWSDWAQELGPAAEWQGSAEGDGEGGLVVRGTLRAVDWHRLGKVGRPDMHTPPWTGQAEIELANAVFSQGRLQSMQGRMVLTGGEIDTGLLQWLCEMWQLSPPETPQPRWPYQTLQFDFKLAEGRLAIRGADGRQWIAQGKLGTIRAPRTPSAIPASQLLRIQEPAELSRLAWWLQRVAL